MGKNVNPEKVSAKWASRLTGAIGDIVEGVNGVTESPMEKAAGKSEKMLANLSKSVTSGKWANSLRKVPLETWKSKTAAKVKERLAGGVQAAMPKRQEFDRFWIPRTQEVSARIASMPDLTLQDSINRAAENIRLLAEQPYKK